MEQIPCRTAMRGRFPLNGTYFQVNEVTNLHATGTCFAYRNCTMGFAFLLDQIVC